MLFSPTLYYQTERMSTDCSVVSRSTLYILNSWFVTLKNQIDVTRYHLDRGKKKKGRLFEEKHILSVKIRPVHHSILVTQLM